MEDLKLFKINEELVFALVIPPYIINKYNILSFSFSLLMPFRPHLYKHWSGNEPIGDTVRRF